MSIRSDADIASFVRVSHVSLAPVVGVAHSFSSTEFPLGRYDLGCLECQSCSICLLFLASFDRRVPTDDTKL